MNIEIPESLVVALQAKAVAKGVSASLYARQVLERDLLLPYRHQFLQAAMVQNPVAIRY